MNAEQLLEAREVLRDCREFLGGDKQPAIALIRPNGLRMPALVTHLTRSLNQNEADAKTIAAARDETIKGLREVERLTLHATQLRQGGTIYDHYPEKNDD